MGKPEAVLIRTPSDFERVLAGSGLGEYVKAPLVSPPPDIEPDFRRALDEIFTDLQYVEPGDAKNLAVYLESIWAPLQDLSHLGFMIFALVTHGTLTLPDDPILGAPLQRQIPEWSRTYFLVIPEAGAFLVGEDEGGTIHRFTPRCEVAVAALAKAARDRTPISMLEFLELSSEFSALWCERCRLDSVAEVATESASRGASTEEKFPTPTSVRIANLGNAKLELRVATQELYYMGRSARLTRTQFAIVLGLAKHAGGPVPYSTLHKLASGYQGDTGADTSSWAKYHKRDILKALAGDRPSEAATAARSLIVSRAGCMTLKLTPAEVYIEESES